MDASGQQHITRPNPRHRPFRARISSGGSPVRAKALSSETIRDSWTLSVRGASRCDAVFEVVVGNEPPGKSATQPRHRARPALASRPLESLEIYITTRNSTMDGITVASHRNGVGFAAGDIFIPSPCLARRPVPGCGLGVVALWHGWPRYFTFSATYRHVACETCLLSRCMAVAERERRRQRAFYPLCSAHPGVESTLFPRVSRKHPTEYRGFHAAEPAVAQHNGGA